MSNIKVCRWWVKPTQQWLQQLVCCIRMDVQQLPRKFKDQKKKWLDKLVCSQEWEMVKLIVYLTLQDVLFWDSRPYWVVDRWKQRLVLVLIKRLLVESSWLCDWFLIICNVKCISTALWCIFHVFCKRYIKITFFYLTLYMYVY